MLASCFGSPKVRSNVRPDAQINPNERIAVMPAKFGESTDLVLPDIIAMELIGYGFNVVERSVLAQMAREVGLDLTEIVNGQEYFKLGSISELNTVLLVTAQMEGSAVANATARLVRIDDGTIVMSASYSQPAPNRVEYALHDSVIDSGERLAKAVAKAAGLR